uniref:Uncharacterized protein n=1 Tax=Timema genevievae TaxID=629358 RepID=A0A7R9PLG1_TIMGE|nr:unnamed protein product [Timema genevievae]
MSKVEFRAPRMTCSLSESSSLVRTEFVRNLYKEHPQKEEKVARFFPDIKLLTSEDIAQTVLYCLASPPHMQVHDIIMRPRGQLI